MLLDTSVLCFSRILDLAFLAEYQRGMQVRAPTLCRMHFLRKAHVLLLRQI